MKLTCSLWVTMYLSSSSNFVNIFVHPNLSKICSQSVSLVVYYWYLYLKKLYPLWCILYCLFPGCIVPWAWSLAKGQYMVSWLLTGAPEQRYWQNRETAKVGLDSSVGRAPACQSGGHRFKSRSCKFVFVHPNLSKICTQSVSLVVYYMIFI